MNVTPETTVAEIASRMPRSIPVFQKHGIDFCCGGRRPLSEVCSQQDLGYEAIVDEIAKADGETPDAHADWSSEPSSALIDHIVTVYHARLRDELPRLEALAEKVVSVHGANHPDTLPTLLETFRSLRDELESHMEKEEHVLFPYVRDLEAAARGLRPLFSIPLGLASGAVSVMEREHEVAGLALKTIRRTTDDFRPPDGACGSFQALYAGLQIFEVDLHRHIHLENNILFPRALETERTLRSGEASGVGR
jgi:regulator of cell morphogenesis and NO signaling